MADERAGEEVIENSRLWTAYLPQVTVILKMLPVYGLCSDMLASLVLRPTKLGYCNGGCDAVEAMTLN